MVTKSQSGPACGSLFSQCPFAHGLCTSWLPFGTSGQWRQSCIWTLVLSSRSYVRDRPGFQHCLMPLGGKAISGLTISLGPSYLITPNRAMEMAGLRAGVMCQFSEALLCAVPPMSPKINPWDADATTDSSTLEPLRAEQLAQWTQQV